MEKKIAIVIATLMMAALVAPAVMADDVEYSATVVTCDISVTTDNIGFGNLVAGSDTNLIENSLYLHNIGGADCNVSAEFTTSNVIYGLTSDSDVIGGSNFSIGPSSGSLVLLENTADDTFIGSVLASNNESYNANLKVPTGQATGFYNGTVQLTFTTKV